MTRRTNSKWITRKETPIYCIDFSGLGSDRQGLQQEMNAAEIVLCQQAKGSLLLAVDIHQTSLLPEITDFFRNYTIRSNNPILKMAVLGVSSFQRLWYSWLKSVSWPKNAAFFDDYEKAKDWLISERF